MMFELVYEHIKYFHFLMKLNKTCHSQATKSRYDATYLVCYMQTIRCIKEDLFSGKAKSRQQQCPRPGAAG